jgi:NitT/TauT family transport system substrate-binding protein
MAIDNLFDKLNDDKLSRRTVLKIGIATGVGMAGLAAAGCTSPSPSATPLPATATPLPALTNGAGYLKTDHQAAIFIGKAKGIFEKYGVDLKITNFAAGPAMMQQLSGGTIDLGFAGVPPIISVIDKDSTVKIIAALQGNGSGIIVGNSSGITKVADLKGKKIAVPSVGSIQDIMLRKLLADNNIDYTKDVTVSAIAAGQQPAAISAGTVDAAFTWEPFVSQAEMKGLAKVLIRSDQIQPNHPCCAVATTTKAIQKYPETLKGFLKGLNEATTFVLTNPQETAQILSGPDYTGVEAAIEAAALPHMLFLAKPDETFISGTENFVKEMRKLTALGLTKDHDRNDLFDLTLINQAIP